MNPKEATIQALALSYMNEKGATNLLLEAGYVQGTPGSCSFSKELDKEGKDWIGAVVHPTRVSGWGYVKLCLCNHAYGVNLENGITDLSIPGQIQKDEQHLLKANDLLQHRTLTIEVEGGAVTEVSGLPDGWNYDLVDHDNDEIVPTPKYTIADYFRDCLNGVVDLPTNGATDTESWTGALT